jgi:IclR family pca regulon transcriptional regulator
VANIKDRQPNNRRGGRGRLAAEESELFVRAFARGLVVVEAMGAGAARQTIADVATAAALPRSVVRRLLATLVELRYAATDGKRYWLTPRVLKLGLSYLYALPFWKRAQRVLEDLRAETRESCSMAVLDGEDIVYVLRLTSRRILAMDLSIGSRLPAHAISLGRALLAGLDDAALARYCNRATFKRLTPRTEVSPVRLRKAIEQVRRDGYSWVDAELDEAISGIAVPVRDDEGQVVASINVSFAAGTLDEAGAKERYLAPLRQAAARIRRIG